MKTGGKSLFMLFFLFLILFLYIKQNEIFFPNDNHILKDKLNFNIKKSSNEK